MDSEEVFSLCSVISYIEMPIKIFDLMMEDAVHTGNGLLNNKEMPH